MVNKDELYKRFKIWVYDAVSGLPENTAALDFNSYEESSNTWSVQLTATDYFGPNSNDWCK
ncbi:MAG: hypothetical protein K2M82_01780 [Lachnospiraceae bacterium]|nr:hypothetical protein [Lachnospiraceae bacterium]